MARGLMQAINISPGQPVYVEDYRMQDQGLEWNAQNELDYRTEYLMTNRVVMEEISSETLWGLTGWTPANSLKITQVTGNLVCDVGMSSIGGRRHVRTSSGNITPTGTAGDNTYWIRVKYDTSSDTHTFVGEPTSSPPQADTSTDKRVTLATAVKSGGSWTGTPVDKRTSNTQLTPPAVISGNAGSNPVLSLHQEGSGLGLLITGGDLQVGDATYNQQLIVYGTSTFGVTIYDNPGGYSVEMIVGAANTLKVQTIGGTAATITAANITAIGGPTISSTGIDMNTGTITDAGTINGLSISAGTISSGTWQGTDIAAAYLGAHNHTAAGEGGDYPWADITGFGSGGSATTVSRSDHTHSTDYYTKTEQQDWPKNAHYLDKYTSGNITETTYLSYPVLKIPSLSSDWAYYFFRIPHTWNSGTSSKVVFVVNSEATFTNSSDWYIEVKGYKPGESPSAAWNITTGSPGTAMGGTIIMNLATTSGGINFDAGVDGGDLVVARFKWDGIENDQISYIYDAYITYQ